MTKYFVNSADFKETRYEGFDQEEALKTWHGYNGACGDWYLDEYDFDEPEEENKHTWVFWKHDYLTCLYGDDEAIKRNMKMAIEYLTGKKIIDFELDYNDPGDSGNDATFWAHNIKWESKQKKTKKLLKEEK